jgi:hypothetical protein
LWRLQWSEGNCKVAKAAKLVGILGGDPLHAVKRGQKGEICPNLVFRGTQSACTQDKTMYLSFFFSSLSALNCGVKKLSFLSIALLGAVLGVLISVELERRHRQSLDREEDGFPVVVSPHLLHACIHEIKPYLKQDIFMLRKENIMKPTYTLSHSTAFAFGRALLAGIRTRYSAFSVRASRQKINCIYMNFACASECHRNTANAVTHTCCDLWSFKAAL